ncbi:hypothetical protein VSU19_19440 [Verrucomicrobiales bacterium BCK34]|nr:hypothetical protein [Verrucomicrobiales bacterium BCK34]
MMQDTLFLAEIADQNERWNTLFLILGLGTAIAALIWLILWLGLGNGSEEGSAEAETSKLDTKKLDTKEREAEASKPSPKAEKVESKAETENAAEVSATSEATGSKGDDLSKLGLGAATIAALNGRGITSYEQIADWNRSDIVSFSSEFGSSESDVDFTDLPWKANALAAGIDLKDVDPNDPAFGAAFEAPAKVDHAALIKADFSGEEVRNDADLGIVYADGAKASHEDDLTAIKGVGPVLSGKLNEYGVFCYKQMAAWSDHNVSEFSNRLNCFKNRIERDRWIPQAKEFDCAGEDVETFKAASEEEAASTFATELASGTVKQDSVYGILYAEKPADVDDLKKIKGVGKVLEGKLNGIGVYRFKQVGVWTQPSCEEFAKLLTAFKDRIYRDNWIAQAKRLHNEKYDDKL